MFLLNKEKSFGYVINKTKEEIENKLEEKLLILKEIERKERILKEEIDILFPVKKLLVQDCIH